MKNISSRYVIGLLLILAVAGILRFYDITHADVITDEVLIAFRSIGYIDFFVSPYQTTPYEWFLDIPTWAKISFHDHPPLIFGIQYWFFKLLGQSLIILRLPFILAGIGSVFLLYLIGKKLFNQQIGIIASLLLAVSSYHVWISRIGLQESIVIMFSLAAFYFFIKTMESGKYWQWGIVLGLAMLTKHSALILLPIFLSYFLLFKREVFKDKRFWLAIVLVILIFSPVLIYNLKLYQTQGHFDLQFSYLFNQKVTEWEFLPGKIMAGSLIDRVKNLIPAFYQGMLWPMFILGVISFIYSLYHFWKQKNKSIFLLILAIFFYLFFFLLIGPSKRFVVMAIPFIILLVAWFISRQQKLIKYSLIALLIILEIFFSINTLLAHQPIGREGVTYSYLRKESYSWGYNQLNTYLVQLLKDKSPGFTFTTRYQFLEDIKNTAIDKAHKKNIDSKAILLIYDVNMYDLATLWIFHRQMIYQGWPVVTADDYLAQGKFFWIEQGVKDFYFFKILDQEILQKPQEERTDAAESLAGQLSDIDPEIIKRPDGRDVFAVYYWQ